MSCNKLAELGHLAAMSRYWRRRMRRKDCSAYTIEMFVYYQEKMDAQIDVCEEFIKEWLRNTKKNEEQVSEGDTSTESANADGQETSTGEEPAEPKTTENPATTAAASTASTSTNSTRKGRTKAEVKP